MACLSRSRFFRCCLGSFSRSVNARPVAEPGLADGEAFAPDFVYSNVVCVHVHPDETEEYFRNLARLAHKPGARLLFNARLTDTPVRFEFDGWS